MLEATSAIKLCIGILPNYTNNAKWDDFVYVEIDTLSDRPIDH